MASAQLWSFTFKRDVLELFDSSVMVVQPATTSENFVKVFVGTPENITCHRLSLELFFASDFLKPLEECSTGKDFTARLLELKKLYHFKFFSDQQVEYASDSEDMAVLEIKKKKKKIFSHKMTFKEEVEVLHGLHPKAGKSEFEMLDAKDVKWRREAESALKYEKGLSDSSFGGMFREQIYIACLSDRCYNLAMEVMAKYSNKELKDQRNLKVNRCLFSGFVGLREEKAVFELLGRLNKGILSKEEANEEAIRYKRQIKNKEESQGNKQHQVPLRAQILSLRLENANLVQRINFLEEENTNLKERLKKKETINVEEVHEERGDIFTDPFIFQDDEPEMDTQMKESEPVEDFSGFDPETELLKTYRDIEKLNENTESSEQRSDEDNLHLEKKKSNKKTVFNINEKVMAKWSDRKFYRGKITKIDDDRFNILFDDGYRRIVKISEIKKL